MQRCPNCRARYRGGETCRRCGMELTLLMRLETRVRRLERTAVQQLLEKDYYLAETILQRALSLRATPMAISLLRFTRQQKRRRMLRKSIDPRE